MELKATWYFHSYMEWLKLSNRSSQLLLGVCLAAHSQSLLDGLPYMSIRTPAEPVDHSWLLVASNEVSTQRTSAEWHAAHLEIGRASRVFDYENSDPNSIALLEQLLTFRTHRSISV